MPFVLGAVALGFKVRPRPAVSTRALDLALVACLIAVAFQLVPLPAGLRTLLAPAHDAVTRALFLTGASSPRAISLDPPATVGALVVGGALLLLFWTARSVFAEGGVRTAIRGLAWTGLALAVVAIVQHGTAPRSMFWLWQPPGRDPSPFGPFVNRNFLATWIVMVVPLLVGYALARIKSRQSPSIGVVDATMLWLVVAAFLLTATLLLTTSRSGVIGLVAGLALLVSVSRMRLERRQTAWLLTGLALVGVAVSIYLLNASALASRLDETMREGIGGRRTIWRETWAIVRDFWPGGVGLGGFKRAMLVYQQSPRDTFFNNAHSEYLQIAVEGGLLVAVPAALAALLLLREIVRRLAADRSAMFWVRAGAAAGLFAAGVQSVWEVGLQLPANAVAAVLLAAIAVHDAGLRNHFGAPRTMR